MSKTLENINHLELEGKVMAIYDPTDEVMAAVQAVSLSGKPRFGVSIQLAVLNKDNRNHHHITLAQADKAIASYGDRHEIPGNFDHKTGAYGTSYKFWIKNRDEDEPELFLEAVYWNRYINETKKAELMAAYKNSQLGASWEIDKPFELVPAGDGSETIYIEDFAFAGFALMINDAPAEPGTQGTATLTATYNADPCFWGDSVEASEAATDSEKLAQEKRAAKYGIGIKEGGNVTKPTKSKSITIANFADPVNYKWLVDEASVSTAVAYFNQSGMRLKGHYTVTEWSKIGGTIASKAGEGYEYRGGKITSAEEAETAGHVMKPSSYGELPIDFLRAIPCPTCGSWPSITTLDFKEGKFELECDNDHYDNDRPSHKYLVTVSVEEQGEVTSGYHLAPVESSESLRQRTFSDGEIIEVALVATTQSTEEVNTVEKKFTQEEQDAAIKAAVENAEKGVADKLKADQDAVVTQKKDVDAQVDAQVKEKVEAAKNDAVAAYKTQEAEAATRIEAAHKAMPYASDEDKAAAKAELLAMSKEVFDSFIAMRELLGKNVLLEAQLAGKATEALTATLKLGLPIGEDVEGDAVKVAAAAKLLAESDTKAKLAWAGL